MGETPMNQPIRVTVATEQESRVAASLLLAQQARQRALDARLPTSHVRAELEATLTASLDSNEYPLVALDTHGRVRGYVQPAVWQLSLTSILRAFLSLRNGIARTLALPDPSDEDAPAVATALLAALSECWQSHETTGDLIRWPSADPWLEPVLAEQGFRLDSVCALRSLQLLEAGARASLPAFIIRPARPDDEEVLVELLDEELRYHERYTPFVRSSPIVLDAFRRKLARLWAGASLAEGAPLIRVVEQGREIVAMAENTLLDMSLDDEPGFTPSGRYGCIDNVSVREELRGQGIGRLLVQAIFEAFAATGVPLDGYVLWYNPDNPQAGRFWPRMGFVPIWTTYQRLHAASGSQAGT
jgi:GNAT superfamily N-acetyltransferase